MDYRQALAYVLGFSNFEVASPDRLRYRDFNITRVAELLRRIGNPHLQYPTVHVAGSKGKGSTCAMVASVAKAAGLRTGLYTSPHLHTLRERIQVNGEKIKESEFADGTAALRASVAEVNAEKVWGQLSTFEVLTALGFRHLATNRVDLGVIEVGLGGRLDATSVVDPAVCAITSLSLDHVEVLGASLPEIAAEKAAIIKPGVPVVSAPQPPEALEVVVQAAKAANAPLLMLGRDISWERRLVGDAQDVTISTPLNKYEIRVPLGGRHQAENAAIAVGICELLRTVGPDLGREAIEEGVASVRWAARLETLPGEPRIVVDGAHNPYSMKCFREALSERYPNAGLVLVFGANSTKNLEGMAAEVAPLTNRVIATRSRHPKATPSRDILEAFSGFGVTAEATSTVSEAMASARCLAGSGDVIAVTGSLFVAAEAREEVLGIGPEVYPG